MKTCLKVLYVNSLFTIFQNWNELKIPSRDEWINRLWQIHTVETYIAIKRNNIDESQKHHAKWKKPDTKRCTLYDAIYMTSRIDKSVISKGEMAKWGEGWI